MTSTGPDNGQSPTKADSLITRLKNQWPIALLIVAAAVIVNTANVIEAGRTIARWASRRERPPQLILRIKDVKFGLDSVFVPTDVFNASGETWRVTNATLSEVPREFEARMRAMRSGPPFDSTMEAPGYEWLKGPFDTVVVAPGQTVSFVVRAANQLLYWKGWCGLNPRVAVVYEFLASGLRELRSDPIVVARITPDSGYPDIVKYYQGVGTLEIPSMRMVDTFPEGPRPIIADSAAHDEKAYNGTVAAAYRRRRVSMRRGLAEFADSCAAVIKNHSQLPIDSSPATRSLPYYLIRIEPRWKDP